MIRLAEVEINTDAARLLGFENAMRYTALPIGFDEDSGEHLRVAISEPFDAAILTSLADVTEHFIIPIAAEENDLRFYINKIFGGEEIDSIASRFLLDAVLKNQGRDSEEISDELLAEISSAPAVQFIDSLLEAGVLNRASDIHIEPFGKSLRARYRVDGVIVTYSTVDISLLPNVISRLKIIAKLDIAEKRMPQDGHFSSDGVDFRLSTLPTAYGEKAVIRILQKIRLKKHELGFFEDDLAALTELFSRPYGAIFMTGPTGSGKSTTLNCFLEELDSEALNIITVEDPVESPILGISHVNVDKNITFASALRHILRQDPDVIMVGEVRDKETARISIQAAITGHVVLSTIHTNDAAGVIERLSDMGIETYLTAAALNGIISQRLVRKICRECAAPAALTPRQAQILKLPIDTLVYKGMGCVHCNQTGYSSRLAIYEYIILNEKSRRKIAENPVEFALELREKGGMYKNAIRTLKAGTTTAEEIIRVLNNES